MESKTRCRSASKASSMTSRSSASAGRHAEQAGVGAAGGEVAVADVVDEAGEAVDGHEVVAPGPGQEEGGHGEVLRRGLVERAALRLVGARRAGSPSPRAARGGDGTCCVELGSFRSHCRHISRSTPPTQYALFRTRRPAVRAAASRRVSRIIAPLAAIRDRYSLRCTTRHGSPGCPAHHNNTPIGPKIPKVGRS